MQGKQVGPFVVGELIGRGGMGEVLRARATAMTLITRWGNQLDRGRE